MPATTAWCICGRPISNGAALCSCGHRLSGSSSGEPVSRPLTPAEAAIFGALQARLALLEDRLMRRIDQRLESLRVAIDNALIEADAADDDDENPEDEEE